MRRFWDHLPFAARLLATASFALVVAGATMILTAARQEARQAREDMATALADELDTLPAALAETVVIGDFSTLQQMLDRYVARPLLIDIRYRDTSGTELVSRDDERGVAAPAWFLEWFGYAPVSGSMPVTVGGRVYGELDIALSPQQPAARAWQRLQNHLAILLLAVSLDFVGIWLVLRFGLRPLKRLERAAAALAAGRLDTRLEAHGSTEIRHLIEGFNRMAATLQENIEKLNRSEALLRSSIDAIGEAFVIYDADDCLVYCNEEYRLLYPSVAELLKPGARFEDVIRAWAEGGAPDIATRDIEAWVKGRLAHHRNGNILIQHVDNDRWVRIIEKRTPEGYTVGFRVDITELVRARETAEAAAQAKSRFLATIGHEIRTPLNGVLGMAQLLLAPEVSDEERREYARTILHSGQSLLGLLNDLLDYSALEAGQLEIRGGTVEPEEMLRETIMLFGTSAREKGLDLTARWLGPSGRRYRGDARRLRQMLDNYVNNAIKFTAAGAVHVEAQELAGKKPDEVMLEFSVTDSGSGISSDDQRRLFRPFSQLDDSHTRSHGGTGLGLAIVKSLAQRMGGQVGVESAPGQGSRFWFRVPSRALAPDEDSRQGERAETQVAATDAGADGIFAKPLAP